MSTDIPKTYTPKSVEDKIYKLWEEGGFFTPEKLPISKRQNENVEKFVTCIAPPNITGELHMGHALQLTLQDIIVRMKRMQGYKTLWVPGIDHAGISAQNVVEKELKKEGISRQKLGREKFEKRVEEWKEKYGSIILGQFKKLGISVDWTRMRYTRDKQYEQAVIQAFKHYYQKGWIYQAERVINWCPRCTTSISDLEVNYVPEKGKLYFIKYGPFILATTRPETKLGDTALAINPNDGRYKKYIGQKIEIETINTNIPKTRGPELISLKLPVVADLSVDKDFGTGIIKVTPAHDITDSEIGQRHNLSSLTVIDKTSRMNESAGIRYQGLKTSEAREKIVADLSTLGLIEKVEDNEHNVARCDRCNSIIEPLPSKQWFLKMDELKKLALEALDKKEINFHPKRWAIPYQDWLNNIRDWNISRQLWWGHRLPVWFHEPKCIPKPGKEKDIEKCIEIIISETEPQCQFCDAKYIQSEDVLDTWFSSALWPFAGLGWPANATTNNKQLTANDFKEYYPTQFITSARDILFLWIVRMIFSGKELTGKTPFKDIFIHPTVLTKEGRRMSKSLGTGINPLELIEKYGTDALRFGLASQTSGLQDLRFSEDLIVMGKKFANKVWNIARYVIMKLGEDYEWKNTTTEELIEKYAWGKQENNNSKIVAGIDGKAFYIMEQIEKYNFAEAANSLYKFVWHEFADKFIEESKNKEDQETKDTLAYLLINSLKLLHPFMPFITEEIYGIIQDRADNKDLLMVTRWPSENEL